MDSWPRLVLAENRPTIVVFTASLANKILNTLLSDDFTFELCLRKLSLTQQLKIRNTKHNRAKALSLVLFAQVVLNYTLFSAGVTPDFEPFRELPVVLNEYGKPSLNLENGPIIEYNSSSSNDLMAIVVQVNGATPIGIDLSHETQSSISETDFVEQFLGIFAPQELIQLEAEQDLSRRYVFFNQLWTLKEAFTKFVGCGLNVDLSSFYFLVGPDRPILVDPKVISGKHYKKVEMDWQKEIKVNFENLEPKFKNRISHEPVRCQSGVLRKGSSLPVLISLVGQVLIEYVDIIDITMETVVQSVLDE